jgi:hypothetical protein
MGVPDFFFDLPTCEETTKLKQMAKGWDYRPELHITLKYMTDFQDHSKTALIESSLSIIIRDKHRCFVETLEQFFNRFKFNVKEDFIQTLDIPEGDYCCDCGDTILLPYYFYPWSKVHRCISCAEIEDPRERQRMKRYAVNESAVLVFMPNTNVDI